MTDNTDGRRQIIDGNPLEGLVVKSRPSHCKRGHDLTAENTYEFKKKGRLYFRCKACNKAQFAAWREKNPERMKELQKRSNGKKVWTPERAEQNRWWRIGRNYGLSREQFEALWESQAGRCVICALELKQCQTRTATGLVTTPDTAAIDHCHATGKVRGILCQQCNHGLGQFADSPERLEAAAAYLRKERP